MNTLKAVLKHLNKEDNVELSSEKVELGVADDLKEMQKEAKRRLSQVEDAVKWGKKAEEAFKVISDADGIVTAANKANTKFLNETVSIFRNIDKKANELGVKPNLIDGYKEALSLIYKVQDSQNELTGWKEAIGKLRV